MMEMKECAVLDIGSNSLRLMRGRLDGSKGWQFSPKELVTTRLGKDISRTGLLAADSIELSLAAMQDWKTDLGTIPVYAIATSAVREAANGEAFLAEIRQRFHWQAQAISGAEEAALSFSGASSTIEAGKTAIVLDIGGGSSETALGHDGQVMWSYSYPLGAVRLSTPQGDMSEDAMLQLQDLCLNTWLPLPVQPELVIGVGGALTSLAAIELQLEPYDPEQVEGTRITLAQVTHHMDRVRSMSAEERRHICGLQPKRADIILAGLVIAHSFLLRYGLNEIQISERDLMEGMFYRLGQTSV